MLKTQRHKEKWRLYFDDWAGEPVGYRNQMGEPFPNSFHPGGWETLEEAEAAKLEMESYIMRNKPKNWIKKKGKK